MNSERWTRVTALFTEACEQPAAQRLAWLDTACDDADVHAEVVALLDTYERDPGFLERHPDVAAGVDAVMDQAVPDRLIGRRLGAYKVAREIGRGGMGVVYEAHRDDEEFDRRAAIKILPAWSAGALAERFRFERRVLAGLDHPGIARLLDAGTTDDGVPYCVMEFVDGQPIDAWCRDRQLSVRDRVLLFERVCEAVAYAHQHLIVHRDVKPANILVTADGQPKLLDFGIATMLADEGGVSVGTTRTGHTSFTPEFASPEQIRGEPVTTASDVYSLGVLLYLLLADRRPYELQGLSPIEAMRTVCEVDPPKPSAVAAVATGHTLRGDLDTIVAKALRKSASERYSTVAELAGELRAWREGRPIAAAPASWAYRTRCFVGRNKLVVGAATAVVLAVLTGGVATAWQARIARQERDKAQNRFTQVQQFSRSLLFDVHAALRTVAGATDARRLLLDRGTQFLDGLTADAGDDDGLKFELAEGYRRLGLVQGVALEGSVGDTASARISLEKAARLAEEALAARAPTVDRLALTMRAQYDLATLLVRRGEPASADRPVARLLAVVEELTRRFPDDPHARAAAAEGYRDLGAERTGKAYDLAGAIKFHEESVRLFESLPEDMQRSDEPVRFYADALSRLGAINWIKQDLAPAERYYRKALERKEGALGRDPESPSKRSLILSTLGDLGGVLEDAGKVDEAIPLWTRALSIAQAVLDSDPKNIRAAEQVGVLRRRLGNAARDAKRYPEAIAHHREAVRLFEMVVNRLGPLPDAMGEQAFGRVDFADTLLDAAGASRVPSEGRALVDEARGLMRKTPVTDVRKPIHSVPVADFRTRHEAVMARLAKR